MPVKIVKPHPAALCNVGDELLNRLFGIPDRTTLPLIIIDNRGLTVLSRLHLREDSLGGGDTCCNDKQEADRSEQVRTKHTNRTFAKTAGRSLQATVSADP